jgi:hypothetical protein
MLRVSGVTTVLRVIEVIFLTVLIVLLMLLGRWAHREAPLMHNALWNFSEASAKVNAAAGAEIEHATNELQETQKATKAIKEFFDRTDLSVNGRHHDGLIPQATILLVKAQPVMDHLNDVAQHLDAAVLNLNALFLSSTATVGQLQDSLRQATELVAALQKQATDPSIKLALDSLAAALQNAATGMGELAAAGKDVHQIADKARETYLKPVNLWWGLVKELLPLAGSAAQVVK